MQVSLPKVVSYKKKHFNETTREGVNVFTSEDVRIEFDGAKERKHIEEHKQELKSQNQKQDLRGALTEEQYLDAYDYSYKSARKYAGVISKLYLTSED